MCKCPDMLDNIPLIGTCLYGVVGEMYGYAGSSPENNSKRLNVTIIKHTTCQRAKGDLFG